MSTEFSRHVDAWSRFVAYCSLVVALGTLGWVWLDSDKGSIDEAQIAAKVTAQVNRLVAEQSAGLRKDGDLAREDWEKKQTAELMSYKAAADSMLQQHQGLIAQLNSQKDEIFALVNAAHNSAVQNSTSQNSTSQNSTAQDSSEPSDEEIHSANDVMPDADSHEDLADVLADETKTDRLSSLNEVADAPASHTDSDEEPENSDPRSDFFSPLLRQVVVTRKTDGTNTGFGVLTVANSGNGQAKITQIEFTPLSDFEVASRDQLKIEEGDVRQITFTSAENLADEPGKHGQYQHKLTEALELSSGDKAQIRLVINNSRHVGWGLRGIVRMRYNGLDPLIVADAHVLFVDDAESIVKN